MTSPAKKIGIELIKALKERPDDFQVSRVSLRDSKTDAGFFINEGAWEFKMTSPYEMPMPYLLSRRCMKAIDEWKARDFLARSSPEPEPKIILTPRKAVPEDVDVTDDIRKAAI